MALGGTVLHDTSESAESIRPDLIIPTGKRKGRNPSLASIYRALAEHEKRQAYPEAAEQAHTESPLCTRRLTEQQHHRGSGPKTLSTARKLRDAETR